MRVKVAHISNKPPVVVEHAFPLTGFVGLSAYAAHVAETEKYIDDLKYTTWINNGNHRIGNKFLHKKVVNQLG